MYSLLNVKILTKPNDRLGGEIKSMAKSNTDMNSNALAMQLSLLQ